MLQLKNGNIKNKLFQSTLYLRKIKTRLVESPKFKNSEVFYYCSAYDLKENPFSEEKGSVSAGQYSCSKNRSQISFCK